MPKVTATTNSIKIDASDAKDTPGTDKYGESGIGEIWYSKDNGDHWETNEDKTKTDYTYTQLTQDTPYAIKVKVIDNATNALEVEVKGIKTGTVTGGSGNITINAPIWDANTHKAKATITKENNVSDNLKIQYQVNSYEETGWTTGETVGELENGNTIYARLWDGTNGGSHTSIKVIDDDDPNEATINLSGTSATSETSVTATVTLVDNQSGIDIQNSKWIYTQNPSKIGTDPNKYNRTFNTNPELLTLASTEAGTYYLHVLSVDKAGNKSEAVSGGVTVTSGAIVTYHIDTNNTQTEKILTGHNCIQPTTVTATKAGYIFVGWRRDDKAGYTSKFNSRNKCNNGKLTNRFICSI